MGFDAVAEGAADLFEGAAADTAADGIAAGASDVAAGGLSDAAAGAVGDVASTGLEGGLSDAAGSAVSTGLADSGTAIAGVGDSAGATGLADAGTAVAGAGGSAAGLGGTDALTSGLGADAGIDSSAGLANAGTSITGGAGGSFSDAGFAASDAGQAAGLDPSYVGSGTADYSSGVDPTGATSSSSSPYQYAQGDYNDATGTYTSPTGDSTTLPAQNAEQVAPGAAGNSSVQSALQQLGALGSNASKYAPIASLAMNAYAQHKEQSAADQLKGIAQPVTNESNSLLNQYNSGQINPAQAYQIAQWTEQQTAAVKNYYSNAGLGNSSMEAEALANVNSQAQAMREQAAQSLLTSGLQAAQISYGPQESAVQASVASDAQLQQASSSFLAALAKINAGQPSTNTSTTTAGG